MYRTDGYMSPGDFRGDLLEQEDVVSSQMKAWSAVAPQPFTAQSLTPFLKLLLLQRHVQSAPEAQL